MQIDRHNRWFQAAMAVGTLCVLLSALELTVILTGGGVPPEWTNWLLMAMPAASIGLLVVALARPRIAQPA